ncbi:MAG: TOMM precursor leader peptide-binding protein [Gammaproteobacteria bacterium]|nr:TOMM precursor leader peptide-binding protein [Gammaproteobacteria bacterium]
MKATTADRGVVRLPAITPHLEFHVIGEQLTLLVSESFNTLLHGELYCKLLPLVDGRRGQDEIAAALKPGHTGAEVRAAIASLSAKGYVVSAEHGMERDRAAYWSSLGASPRWAEQQLAGTCVEVEGDEGHLARRLEQQGAAVGTDGSKLAVIVCEDYLSQDLAEVNRRRLTSRAPWMLVRPRGMQPLFGPVFGADEAGPCWACLAYRLGSHQEVHQFLRNIAGDAAAFKPFAAEPTLLEALYGLVAAEIVKWLVLNEAAPVHEQAIALDVGTFTSSHHPVMRRPQCPACGDEALYRPDRPPIALHLKASPRAVSNSGGTRTVAPEVTLAKYRHLVSPVSGVVTWLKRTTDDADSWLHVYWAGSNLGVRSRTLSSLRRSLRSKSAGKGSTREQSEASALCEALERYSGCFHGDEIRARRRFTEFAGGEEAIHPNEVQLFSDTQLDNAQRINAKGHPYNIVPPRLNPDAEIDWTPVWSLTQQRHRHLPTSMLYSMAPEQRGPSELIADSNGCAAGNTLEEAILQGFYELAERDAFAIWWYNRMQVPAVDLSGFDDDYLASAPDYYDRYGRDLWMLDVTSDIGIPVFVALSRRPDGETEDIIYGAGAHADPGIAALRAICELNQCLTWLPRPGSRDGRPMIDDPLALWWWKTARLADCPWLSPSQNAPPVQRSQYPAIESEDMREDVEHCRSLVEARGMEFLVLDQTRPDVRMPVVRVIVPGMRHFWERLAPGRLYDVPVVMGRRNSPLSEADLNSVPVIA